MRRRHNNTTLLLTNQNLIQVFVIRNKRKTYKDLFAAYKVIQLPFLKIRCNIYVTFIKKLCKKLHCAAILHIIRPIFVQKYIRLHTKTLILYINLSFN